MAKKPQRGSKPHPARPATSGGGGLAPPGELVAAPGKDSVAGPVPVQRPEAGGVPVRPPVPTPTPVPVPPEGAPKARPPAGERTGLPPRPVGVEGLLRDMRALLGKYRSLPEKVVLGTLLAEAEDWDVRLQEIEEDEESAGLVG